jgi:hypothetical protein
MSKATEPNATPRRIPPPQPWPAAPIDPPKPSRRAVFDAGAALLAGITALAGAANAGPAADAADAELIRLCKEFDVLELQFIALHDGTDRIEDDEERGAFIDPILEAQESLLDQLCALRATTLQGLTPHFRTLMLEDQDLSAEQLLESPFMNQRLMGCLLRDLASVTGVSV